MHPKRPIPSPEMQEKLKRGRYSIALFRAASDGDITLATRMVENGADVNFHDRSPKGYGNSILQEAVQNYYPDIVTLLLANGANPLHTNRKGQNAFTMAEGLSETTAGRRGGQQPDMAKSLQKSQILTALAAFQGQTTTAHRGKQQRHTGANNNGTQRQHHTGDFAGRPQKPRRTRGTQPRHPVRTINSFSFFKEPAPCPHY